MAEHLDQYESWLREEGLVHSPANFHRWVDAGFQPGRPSREDWPYRPLSPGRDHPAWRAGATALGRKASHETDAPVKKPDDHFESRYRGQFLMDASHEITVRVRYAETDRMGLLHHANYFIYFEMARTEMLRQRGISYREIEDSGHFLVIIDIGCKFKRPGPLRRSAHGPDDRYQGHAREDRAPDTKCCATGCSWPRATRPWRASIARVRPQALPGNVDLIERRHGSSSGRAFNLAVDRSDASSARNGRKRRRAMSAQSRLPALSATQRLSSLSHERTQMATGPPGHSMIPAAVRVSSRLPVLKATLVPGGRKRGNLSLSSQAANDRASPRRPPG